MLYTNFDEGITLKYGVVLKNWPLKTFSCPSDTTSPTNLELLYNSWESGATHFMKLTEPEFEAWTAAYYAARDSTQSQVPVADSEAPALAAETPAQGSAPGEPSPTPSPPSNTPAPGPSNESNSPLQATAPAMLNFSVSGPDGAMVSVTVKKRKTRSDAGVKRGSKKARGKENAIL